MNKIIKEALVKEIAESIMTDGNGRKATRLILEFDGKTDNTGRNQISVESVIRKHLESRPLEKLVMPICPYCNKRMSLSLITTGNGCGEYFDETIWECDCDSDRLEKERANSA